jgi:hypothetical protein
MSEMLIAATAAKYDMARSRLAAALVALSRELIYVELMTVGRELR